MHESPSHKKTLNCFLSGDISWQLSSHDQEMWLIQSLQTWSCWVSRSCQQHGCEGCPLGSGFVSLGCWYNQASFIGIDQRLWVHCSDPLFGLPRANTRGFNGTMFREVCRPFDLSVTCSWSSIKVFNHLIKSHQSTYWYFTWPNVWGPICLKILNSSHVWRAIGVGIKFEVQRSSTCSSSNTSLVIFCPVLLSMHVSLALVSL